MTKKGKEEKVEKKFKISQNPNAQKTLYGVVIAILCISAIVVGIIVANNRRGDMPTVDNPPASDNGQNGESGGEENNQNQNGSTPETKPSFIAPVSGKIIKSHSTTTPVFSQTLEAWKIHTGIDISCEEGASVFATSDGEVTAVRNDPMLGKTVEITHVGGVVSVYSNLSPDGVVAVGKIVRQGEKIGAVGDSAISEIADEAHLHFAMYKDGQSTDPLAYISEEAKKSSLLTEQDQIA